MFYNVKRHTKCVAKTLQCVQACEVFECVDGLYIQEIIRSIKCSLKQRIVTALPHK